MKKIIFNLLLLFAIAISSPAFAGRNCKGCPSTSNNNSNTTSLNCLYDCPVSSDAIMSLPYQDISDAEKADLIFMREEEKLARDVYEFLYAKWGLKIFQNISYSEQRHTDAVKSLLIKYSITDPLANDQRGVFANSELQVIYNDLTAKGSNSLTDALYVGATIEDLDIKDLKEAVMLTDNEDIKLVYDNLTRGSRNHLRSFVTQLKLNNLTYIAQFLTQAEVDEIVNSARERGNCRNCVVNK